MRAGLILVVAAILLGCPATGMPPPGPAPSRLAPASRIEPSTALPADIVRVVPQTGTASQLIGKVKLLSENGTGVISNHGGGLISDQGGSLTANRSATGTATRFSLLAVRPEALLAAAQVEIVDAEGRVLTDEGGRPLGAITDNQGAYSLTAVLPTENLLLRVRLGLGGQLLSIVVREPAAIASTTREVDIDTASSLGAVYVLDRFVQGRQAIFDRLPGAETARLQRDVEAARGALAAGKFTYGRADLLAAAESLRQQNATLDRTLEGIEALLLVGADQDGRSANTVALGQPTAAVGDGRGGFYIAETFAGRIRHVGADGTVRLFAGQEKLKGFVWTMIAGPGGSLYVGVGYAVVKIEPDGQIKAIAGTGDAGQGPLDVPATTSAIERPADLALATDGTLYLTESPGKASNRGRLLAIDPAGVVHQIGDCQAPRCLDRSATAIAVDAEDTLYALHRTIGMGGALARRRANGTWQVFGRDLEVTDGSRILSGDDGAVYVTETTLHQVIQIDRSGERTMIAGSGQRGTGGDGGPATAAEFNLPTGLWRGTDGEVLIADTGNNLVRQIDRAGIVHTLAGSAGLSQTGDAREVAINGPSGLAIDPQGRPVICEIASHTIKRLENGRLEAIAGTTKGFGGDGGPATRALLDSPSAVAYGPAGDMYVLDTGNRRLRVIDRDGTIRTVAGNPVSGRDFVAPRQAALETHLERPLAIAIGPEGYPYWSDNTTNRVLRLTNTGDIELVAGSPTGEAGDAGDGGKATSALLSLPVGLAFDAAGNLYVADTGNMRIRRIGRDGIIEAYAGRSLAETLAALFRKEGTKLEKQADDQAIFVGPFALAIDPAGALYVTEVGTANLQAALGSKKGVFPTSGLRQLGSRVRRIAPDRTIETIAGYGMPTDSPAGRPLEAAVGLAIDTMGRLIVSDGSANQVLILPKPVGLP